MLKWRGVSYFDSDLRSTDINSSQQRATISSMLICRGSMSTRPGSIGDPFSTSASWALREHANREKGGGVRRTWRGGHRCMLGRRVAQSSQADPSRTLLLNSFVLKGRAQKRIRVEGRRAWGLRTRRSGKTIEKYNLPAVAYPERSDLRPLSTSYGTRRNTLASRVSTTS